MNNFNKSLHTWIAIIILLTFTFLTGGFLIWQFSLFGKEIKTGEVKFFEKKIEKLKQSQEKEIAQTSKEITEGKISEGKSLIPSSIVRNYDKLKEYILNTKICKSGEHNICEGLEYDPYLESYFQVFREDLNRDDKEEVIMGLNFEKSSWIGLLVSEGENYKLVNWIDNGLSIKSIELRKLPNKQFFAVAVTTAGGVGTGMSMREMRIYNYLNGQLKLTWRGSLEESISGWDKEVENTYYISFLDNDRDGDLEILQRGTEKEGKGYDEKGNLIVTKETLVEKIFKWNYKSQQFEQISK